MTRAAWWCARNFPLMFSKKAVIMKYWDGRWTPEGLWQLYFALLSSLLITAYKWVHDTLDCFFVRLRTSLSIKFTNSLTQIINLGSNGYNNQWCLSFWKTMHFQKTAAFFQLEPSGVNLDAILPKGHVHINTHGFSLTQNSQSVKSESVCESIL